MEKHNVEFQFHNHLRECRCIQGLCRNKRGCGKAVLPNRTVAKLQKTYPTWLSFNRRSYDETYQSIDELIMENRSELLKGVVFDKTDRLDAQDLHIPTALFHTEREIVFKMRGIQRRQIQQKRNLKSSKSRTELLWEEILEESTDVRP